MLQKSQNAERLIFRERTKQAAIAHRCSLKRAAEVACEFVAGCSSPPHQYSIAAPTAREILDRWWRKTFPTNSAPFGHGGRSDVSPECAQKRIWVRAGKDRHHAAPRPFLTGNVLGFLIQPRRFDQL